MQTTPLPLGRFRKIVNLARHQPHQDGAHNQHQIDAAWAQAERMAEAAGLTLDEAVSKLDAADMLVVDEPVRRAPANPFEAMFAEMNAKRREAASRPWPEHPMEAALRMALEGHDVEAVDIYQTDVPDEINEAIRSAIPWPRTMREAVAEHELWDALEAERVAQAEHYQLGDGPTIRRWMLRDFLKGVAKTPADAVARARWLSSPCGQDAVDGWEMGEWMALVVGDMERMHDALKKARSGRNSASADKPEVVTNREKRDRVRAILQEPGGADLSLRQVARRAGVSVQHVANVREAMAEERQS